MNVNELMLGNYVVETDHNRIGYILSGIGNTKKVLQLKSSKLHTSCELLPIEITAELLVKLGFTFANKITLSFKQYHNETTSDCSYVFCDEGIWYYSFTNKWTVNAFRTQIKFIHELQILWFLLSKNPLQFLEPK